MGKVIVGSAHDEADEIRALGHTLALWHTEILGQHRTGASNRPTEDPNLYLEKVKRCGHGFRSFDPTHRATSAAPRRRRRLTNATRATPDAVA